MLQCKRVGVASCLQYCSNKEHVLEMPWDSHLINGLASISPGFATKISLLRRKSCNDRAQILVSDEKDPLEGLRLASEICYSCILIAQLAVSHSMMTIAVYPSMALSRKADFKFPENQRQYMVVVSSISADESSPSDTGIT